MKNDFLYIKIQTTAQELHEKALEASQKFQRAEVELMKILEEMDLTKAYLSLGYPSLFQYVTEGLKLSEACAFNIINVSRKSRQVPELREEIEKGSLSISKARKVVPILTRANSKEWIAKAIALPQKELEREVARVNPDAIQPREMLTRLSEDRSRFQMGISDRLLKKMRRTQTLLSQRERKPISLEESLEHLCDFYLNQKDPVAKAQRLTAKAQPPEATSAAKHIAAASNAEIFKPAASGGIVAVARQPIPASIKHQIFARDEGKCSFISKEGRKCGSSSFIQIHHIDPVSRGGPNTADNLQSLCHAHHRQHHLSEISKGGITRPQL